MAKDRILDYTIALECLVTPDTEGEIAYRLKMRGTRILSQVTDVGGGQIYSDLDTLYKWRSNIMHGGKSKGRVKKILESEDNQYDFVREIRDYLRQAILFFHREKILENRNSRINFLHDDVDQKIAGIKVEVPK